MLGKVNVHFVFGPGRRPEPKKGAPPPEMVESECLIKVYATHAIPKNTELMVDYGKDYWNTTDA